MPLFPIVTASATSKKSPLILKTKAFNTGILECFRQEATAGASDKSMVSWRKYFNQGFFFGIGFNTSKMTLFYSCLEICSLQQKKNWVLQTSIMISKILLFLFIYICLIYMEKLPIYEKDKHLEIGGTSSNSIKQKNTVTVIDVKKKK